MLGSKLTFTSHDYKKYIIDDYIEDLRTKFVGQRVPSARNPARKSGENSDQECCGATHKQPERRTM